MNPAVTKITAFSRSFWAIRSDPRISRIPPIAKQDTHYNLLRTIEDNFGLEPLTAHDSEARPISGIWK